MPSDTQALDQYIQEHIQTTKNQFRPSFHFTAPVGWLNDPNGFSHFDGQYHLFYQFHPFDSIWGPMHWGHAVSRDFVTWHHLPVALAPDENYDQNGCFSGSAIAKGEQHVLMFTGVSGRQEQCLAIGDGNSYSKVESNPVIRADQLPDGIVREDFRDPKLFEHGGVFYCIVGSKGYDQTGLVVLFRSSDLHSWDYIGIMDRSDEPSGGVWECPDFFRLGQKDILMISPQGKAPEGLKYHNHHSVCYRVGTMDYEKGRFVAEFMDEVDGGFDFYAPQTLLDAQGRRIMIAWMHMWQRVQPSHVQGHGWAGAMTFPRELTFQNGHLYQWPVAELIRYRGEGVHLERQFSGQWSESHVEGVSLDLQVEWRGFGKGNFGVKLFVGSGEETVFTYDPVRQIVSFDRTRSGIRTPGHAHEISSSGVRQSVLAHDGTVRMRFLLDRTSVEGFFQDGVLAMTGTVYPLPTSQSVVFFSEDEVVARISVFRIEA